MSRPLWRRIRDYVRRDGWVTTARYTTRRAYYGAVYGIATRRRVSFLEARRVAFECNICGAPNTVELSRLERETLSCNSCESTVRMRSIVHHLSLALFGVSLKIPDFPRRKRVSGIGLSDWHLYAGPLAQKLDYTNTFYDEAPRLDITQVPAELRGTKDFLISTDVFEHVRPPVADAFAGARTLLKPGGVLILTVPFVPEGPTVEHFPRLHDYKVINRDGKTLLRNVTSGGVEETFENLVFHGGPGETLEMRVFSRAGLLEELQKAGFDEVRFHRAPFPRYGILWRKPWSLPITARSTRRV